MTMALTGAVELLDRSLGYTRVVLAGVRDHHLDLPTPCQGWLLRDLLDHMDDSLDAFLEAALGHIDLDTDHPAPAEVRVERLQAKACLLLGAWARPDPVAGVAIGGADLAGDVLVTMASLEITVHGWDVARAIGVPTPVPAALATELHKVARLVVGTVDRGRRFAPPVLDGVEVEGRGASDGEALLRWLGRRPDWTNR